MTHTPTPWTFVEGKTLLHIETAMDNEAVGGGHPVCSIPKKRIEDARFIYKACNVHDEMLETLKGLLDDARTLANDPEAALVWDWGVAVLNLETLIAKAS